MKRTYYVVLISVLGGIAFFGAGCVRNDATGSQTKITSVKYKKYAIEAGKIVYDVHGTYENGTRTVYFKDWGARETTVSQVEAVGPDGIRSEGGTTVVDDGSMFVFQPGSKQGFKNTVDHSKWWTPNATNTVEDFYNEQFVANGYAKTGEDVVAGKPCAVWEYAPLFFKGCFWKGIPLRTETDTQSASTTSEAKAIIEEMPQDDVFQVPLDIQFKEMKTAPSP